MSRPLCAFASALLETHVRVVLLALVLTAVALRLVIFGAVRVITLASGHWDDRTRPRPEIAIDLGL
jgi:hypothetical protein